MAVPNPLALPFMLVKVRHLLLLLALLSFHVLLCGGDPAIVAAAAAAASLICLGPAASLNSHLAAVALPARYCCCCCCFCRLTRMLTWRLTSQTITSQPTSISTSECRCCTCPAALPPLPLGCLAPPPCSFGCAPSWAPPTLPCLPVLAAHLAAPLVCLLFPNYNCSWPFTLFDDDRVMKMMGLHLPQPQLLAELQQHQQQQQQQDHKERQQGQQGQQQEQPQPQQQRQQGQQHQQPQPQLQPANRALATEAAPAPHVQPGGPAAAAAGGGVQGMPRLTPSKVATGGSRLPTPAMQLSPALTSPGAGLGSGVSAMELSSPHPAAGQLPAAAAAGSGVFQQQQPLLRPAQGPPQAAAAKPEPLSQLGGGLHSHDSWPNWPPAAGAGAGFVPNGLSLQQQQPLPQLRPAARFPQQQQQQQEQHLPEPRLQAARRLH